jgi:predicted permease
MSWLQRLMNREQLDEQLDKELQFHIDQHAAELIASGTAPEEARRQARLAIGGAEQVKENCRDARGTRWLEDFWQDLRYSLRMLGNNLGFTVVALLTLALGVGATTVMFTVINGVLLQPLPYPEPERLVVVHSHIDTWNTAVFGEPFLAQLDFRDCQRAVHSLDLAGVVFDGATLSSPGQPEYLSTYLEITSELFSVLRVPISPGRAFLPDEDRLGGRPVAILGYSVWQRHFGGSPSAIGAQVILDAKPYTVVGVAPASFRYEDAEPDIFTPVGQNSAGYLQNRAAHPVRTWGRLHPDATLAQARAELSFVGSQLARQYPDTNKGRGFVVEPARPDVGDVRSTLWLLLGAVTLVLLIACANVASLLLARAVSREREFALRAALGAARARLIRQCLTESAVLGLLGGALGISLAVLGVRPFVAFWPGDLPRAEEVHLDWRVLLFALMVSLLCGLLFGLAPAFRAHVRRLEQSLRAGARAVVGSSRRLHTVFVVSEIVVAVVLLVAAGMLGRGVLRLSSLDPGLNIHNVLTARIALSPSVLADRARTRAAWKDVVDRAARIPGVESVTAVDIVPMREGNNQLNYWTNGNLPPKNQQPMALASSTTVDYLKVMGIPLLSGRFFTDQDRLDTSPVIVVDDVLAKQAFGTRDVVGKLLWIPDMPCVQPSTNDTFYDCTVPYTIVGVVGHVRYWGLAGDDQSSVRAQIYYPFTQVPDPFLRRWSELMSIAVRTRVAPLSILPALRQELRGSTGDQVLYEVHTIEQLAASSIALQRFLLLLFGIFAGLALLLACIGIYGVLAYLVSRRVPEIGVRMALGATPSDVMRLILRGSLEMIFIGVAIGAAAAFAASRVLIRSVAGVRSTEPVTFVLMILLLIAAALAASFIPARRASRLDPVTALRQE